MYEGTVHFVIISQQAYIHSKHKKTQPKKTWTFWTRDCTLKIFHIDQSYEPPVLFMKQKKIKETVYVFMPIYHKNTFDSFCFIVLLVLHDRNNKKCKFFSASDNLSIHLIPVERFIIGYFYLARYDACVPAAAITRDIIVCIGYHIKRNNNNNNRPRAFLVFP